jgi:hypothetical protein
LKHTQGLLVLATVLFATVPVFADGIPAEFRDKAQDSFLSLAQKDRVDSPGWQAPQSIRENSLVKDKSRFGSDFHVRFISFSEDHESLKLGIPLTSQTDSDKGPENHFDFGFNDDNFTQQYHPKARGRRRNDGNDGGSNIVTLAVVPEPGSRTLFLFGLMAFGLLFYRRNNQQASLPSRRICSIMFSRHAIH